MRYFITCCLLAFSLNSQANITARSFIVSDVNGEVISEKNSNFIQPIASITKLMTVITVLNASQDLLEAIPINFKLARRYHTRLPRTVKTLTRQQLINLAIVKSDNLAAYTLALHYPGGLDKCIDDMNLNSGYMNMKSTVFADPTGLDARNVSTARDLSKLVLLANNYSEIVAASGMAKVSIKVRKRWKDFVNTNPLVRRGEDVQISKTGYIRASGGCIVMLLETELGPRIIVLLGSKSTRTRIPEAEEISLLLKADKEQMY